MKQINELSTIKQSHIIKDQNQYQEFVDNQNDDKSLEYCIRLFTFNQSTQKQRQYQNQNQNYCQKDKSKCRNVLSERNLAEQKNRKIKLIGQKNKQSVNKIYEHKKQQTNILSMIQSTRKKREQLLLQLQNSHIDQIGDLLQPKTICQQKIIGSKSGFYTPSQNANQQKKSFFKLFQNNKKCQSTRNFNNETQKNDQIQQGKFFKDKKQGIKLRISSKNTIQNNQESKQTLAKHYRSKSSNKLFDKNHLKLKDNSHLSYLAFKSIPVSTKSLKLKKDKQMTFFIKTTKNQIKDQKKKSRQINDGHNKQNNQNRNNKRLNQKIISISSKKSKQNSIIKVGTLQISQKKMKTSIQGARSKNKIKTTQTIYNNPSTQQKPLKSFSNPSNKQNIFTYGQGNKFKPNNEHIQNLLKKKKHLQSQLTKITDQICLFNKKKIRQKNR